ncbi:MAG: hypothetical protein QM500_16030 [Methylococcales bacterium]
MKEDQKSIQNLSQALGIFRSLQKVAGISAIERQNFLYWELACLCMDRSRGEEALDFCAALLGRSKTDAMGIAWGVSRGLIEESQLKRSKKTLRTLINEKKATSSNILSLCGLLISMGKRAEAGGVIFSCKELFESDGTLRLWKVWCLQCGVEELPDKDLSTINISEQKMLKIYSSDGNQDIQKILDTLDAAKEAQQWYEFTVSIQILSTLNQHQIIAQNAKTLVEEVGTRQALELAVNSCYQAQCFNDALSLLERYDDKDLSAFLRRIKIYCLESMGKDHEAITLAAMTAQISGHVNDELSLASLHLRLRGDIPAATVILKKQIPFGGIEAKQAIEFAQGLANFDPDLAIDLLRIAHKQGIHEDHLTEAFMLSHSLGEEEINKSIALELFPKISSGKIKSAQMINIDDFMEITKKNQEDQERCWKLYLACQIPIHLLERLNINFDNFFRLCNINADNQQHIQLKSIIYGRFGGRLFIEKFTEAAKEWNLFLDISSLFLAYDLDILDKCIETFGAIHIPENIPLLLLNMGVNIPDPTPLRTDAAREFLKMISNGNIRELVDEPDKYQQVAYVGDDSVGEEDIYFGDMLQKLYDEELISETELTRIQSLKGDDWSTTTGRLKNCQSQPIIFLNYNKCITMAEVGLTDIFTQAFDIVVDKNAQHFLNEEVNNSDQRRDRFDRVSKLGQKVKSLLAKGSLIRHVPMEMQDRNDGPLTLSLITLLHLDDPKDLVWCDDRPISSYLSVNKSPIVGVIDILQALYHYNGIGKAKYYKKILILRANDYRFLPLTADELKYWLKLAVNTKGHFQETSALAIIRRYINRCFADVDTMIINTDSQWERWPNGEIHFFVQNSSAVRDVLLSTWQSNRTTIQKEDISTWLLENFLPERMPFTPAWVVTEQNEIKFIAYTRLLLLCSPEFHFHFTSKPRNESNDCKSYLSWLWNNWLKECKKNYSELYDYIITRAAEIIVKSIKELNFEKVDEDQQKDLKNHWLLRSLHFIGLMPEELQNDLLNQNILEQALKSKLNPQTIIGEHAFDRSDINEAFEKIKSGQNPTLDSISGKTFILSLIKEQTESNAPKLVFKSQSDEVSNMEFVSDALCILQSDNKYAQSKFKEILQAKDWEPKKAEKLTNKVFKIPSLEQRFHKAIFLSEDSYNIWISNLTSLLKNGGSILLIDLLPKNIGQLLRYFSLSPRKNILSTIKTAANKLIEKHDLNTAIQRLSGVPFSIEKIFDGPLQSLSATDANSFIKDFRSHVATPLDVFHYARLSEKLNLWNKTKPEKIVEKYFKDDGDHKITKCFLALAAWTDDWLKQQEDSKNFPTDFRCLIAWLHAQQLMKKLSTPQTELIDAILQQVYQFNFNNLFDHKNEYPSQIDPKKVSPERLRVYGVSYSFNKHKLENKLPTFVKDCLIDDIAFDINGLRIPKAATFPFTSKKELKEAFFTGQPITLLESINQPTIIEWLENEGLTRILENSFDQNEKNDWLSISAILIQFGMSLNLPSKSRNKLLSWIKKTDTFEQVEENIKYAAELAYYISLYGEPKSDNSMGTWARKTALYISSLKSIKEIDQTKIAQLLLITIIKSNKIIHNSDNWLNYMIEDIRNITWNNVWLRSDAILLVRRMLEICPIQMKHKLQQLYFEIRSLT